MDYVAKKKYPKKEDATGGGMREGQKSNKALWSLAASSLTTESQMGSGLRGDPYFAGGAIPRFR